MYAHISKQSAAIEIVEAGIDGLVHVFADSHVSDEFVATAKANNIVVIPTLAVIASVDNQQQNLSLAENPLVKSYLSAEQRSSLMAKFAFNAPGFSLEIAQTNVKRLFDAGVTILAGSDAPNAGTAFGVSTHHEMQLLAEAGLSSTDALKSATYLAAEHFGLQGRGRISQGMRADLTLIEGDPEQDITATLNIKHVFKNGFEIQRELSVKPTSSAPESGVLGDFESSDLDTITGFSWSATDDSMANGKSVASIAHANLNSGALQVTTEIKPDFAFPWAGAAVGDFEPPIEGLNIADYSTLSFRIKGTPGEYRAMVFSAVSSGIPPSQAFQVTEEWQTITLKLTDFVGFEQSAFSGFAFVSGPSIGKFNFVLDDVKLR